MELLSTFSNCKQWWDQTAGKKKYPLTALFLLVLGVFIVSLLANQQVGLLKKAVTAHTELKTLPLIISSSVLGILLTGLCIAYHRREKPEPKPKPKPETPYMAPITNLLRQYADSIQSPCMQKVVELLRRCAHYNRPGCALIENINLKQLEERLQANGEEVLEFFFSTKDNKTLKNSAQYQNYPEMMDLRVAKLLYGLSQKQEFFDQAVEYLQTRAEACGDEKIVTLAGLEAIYYMVYEAPEASPKELARYLVGRGRELLLAKKAQEYARNDDKAAEELEYVLYFQQAARELLDLPIHASEMMYAFVVPHYTKQKLPKVAQDILKWTNSPEAQCDLLLGTPNWEQVLKDNYPRNGDSIILQHQLKNFQKMWKARIEKDYGHKFEGFNGRFEAFIVATADDNPTKENVVESLKGTYFKIVDGKTPKGTLVDTISLEDLEAEVNEFIAQGPKILLREITLAILRNKDPESL